MKKLLSLILICLIFVGVLAACGNGDTSSTNNNNNGTTITDAIFSTEKVMFIDSNNESVYRIVRPEAMMN